ncbi:MAG TPA: M3 family metallopeptidase [Kofleriaceae bacterium]|nr:M3 family metallopeptidase [Kofleriaceae bacterium]
MKARAGTKAKPPTRKPASKRAVKSSFSAARLPPLLAPWKGKYGGLPPFDQVKVNAFTDALDGGMAMYRADIDAIASATTPPTFANTIAALDDAGRALSRASTVFSVYASTMADKAVQKIEVEMAPKMAALGDEVTQNPTLFARIKAVYDNRSKAKLKGEALRLTESTYAMYVRRGAGLDQSAKQRLTEINGRLATLYTVFSQNELADQENQSLLVANQADLAGLPESVIAAARNVAAEQKHKGWSFANTRSSIEPFLTFSTRRDLREKAWKMFVSRGDHPGAHDNNPIIAEILTLRAERAKLLGFTSHAHWIIADNMAQTPQAALDLLMSVWPAAAATAQREIAEMQKLLDEDLRIANAAPSRIEPWDYRFYAERVRKAQFALDQNEVKAYLQLDKLRDSMFWMAQQLYGLTFKPAKSASVYHPDVTAYEVTRKTGSTRKLVGIFYFDPYARNGKRSGAWMSEYRTQEKFNAAITPIVSNNSNFVKGAKGSGPVLISWDDAVTLFHEFGHGLHGLLSNVTYPTLAGTNTKRDFVELPSQLHERWLATPEILSKFALHYQTGKPMPAELRAKIEKARNFNQGFRTVEYLASAIYDLKIHLAPAGPGAKPIDARKFEAAVMAEIKCPPEVGMRHRPTHFSHIFSGDGYSAGYYSYLWADTLTADAADAFIEAGSFFHKKTAKRLHDTILAVGNSLAPEAAFHNFRGRVVDPTALMRDRGFAEPASPAKLAKPRKPVTKRAANA